MRILLVALAFTTSVYLYAQSLPDSISVEIQSMELDSNKVNRLNDLSRNYWRSDVELAKELAFRAFKLSQQIDWKSGECRSLNYIGIAYTNESIFDSATYFLEKAHKLAISIKHERFQYFILNSKGIVQRRTGNYELAIASYIEALDFAERIGTDRQVASIVMNIGNIHYNLDNFKKAIVFYKRSLALYEELDFTPAVDHLLNNLGDVYGKLEQYDSALYYFQESLENKINTDNQRGIGTTYVNMGILYQYMDSLDQVKDYFQKAIAHYQRVGAEADAVHAYYGLAELNIKLNKISLAKQQALNALEVATKHSMIEQVKDVNQLLASIYETQENYQEAFNYFKKYNSIKDSLFTEKTSRTVNELEIKYETAKKEKEIVEANAEIEKKERFQTFLFTVIGIVIVFSLIAILLTIQRFRLRRALLSQEIDTLRAQINSIFGGGVKSLNLTLEQINDGLHKPLSEREYEILSHAISDQTNGEIAETIFVSVNTVKTHLKNVYMKLGVSNRKEALEVLLAKT